MNFELLQAIWHDEIDSTNSEAMRILKEGKPQEGTCICARFQTSGKGSRTNNWQSGPGENLLASFIVYPPGNCAQQPFTLSKATALAVHETLAFFSSLPVEIKWPNDVLVGGKKVAGILIENQWLGANWHAAILGIGINVNQRSFDVEHASSLAINTDKHVDVASVLKQLQTNLSRQYNRFSRQEEESISFDYHECLFGKTGYRTYETGEGRIEARVLQVHADGRIELQKSNGAINTFDLSEARLIY
jgi:BirA family biotin operon repressor/biotin-[acetyl-CoA-carboxylase] ligase